MAPYLVISRSVNHGMSHCLKSCLLMSLITAPLIFWNCNIYKTQTFVEIKSFLFWTNSLWKYISFIRFLFQCWDYNIEIKTVCSKSYHSFSNWPVALVQRQNTFTLDTAGILLYAKVIKGSELGHGSFSLVLCLLFHPCCWPPSYMLIPNYSQPG